MCACIDRPRVKPDYDIHSKDDLLRILKNYLPRGGLPIKTLKDSWPQAQTAIDELERQGKILVTRSTGNAEAGKEGVPRMAFYNEMGKIGVIDEGKCVKCSAFSLLLHVF